MPRNTLVLLVRLIPLQDDQVSHNAPHALLGDIVAKQVHLW